MHAPLGLCVRERAAFFDRALSAGNALEYCESPSELIVSVHVDQIRSGPAVLGDENGRLIAFKLGKNFRCPSLERSNQFGAHKVILK